MNLAHAIAVALESIPRSERSMDVDAGTRRHVEACAIRLLSLTRSMLAGRGLPRESLALICTAVAEDLLDTATPAPRRKVRSCTDVKRRA